MEKRLTKLHVILAITLLFTPLVLIISTGEVRSSISNYAYSSMNHLFAALLTIAGTMFIFNGTAYNSRWYNIALGLSLIGVALTPHYDFPILHYIFAAIFFLGSIFVMISYTSKEQLNLKIQFASIIILALVIHFAFNWYSLF